MCIPDHWGHRLFFHQLEAFSQVFSGARLLRGDGAGGGVALKPASAIIYWRYVNTDGEGGVPLASVQGLPGIVEEESQGLDPWSP